MVFDFALLTLGIGVLYFGAEWLVRGSARLSASLGVSPIVVGLTVVSFGTSAPELVVCVVAALGGNPDLAIGNVMGSNLANIGLILGLTAIVRPLKVNPRVVRREMPILLLVTAALLPLLWDLEITRGDGALLLIALTAYLTSALWSVEDEDLVKTPTEDRSLVHPPDILWILAGTACLVLGGYCIVEGAVQVAYSFGVSQVTIGLTVVAVGTSLPELATALVAAARSETDIAVGNVIGSNIFNVTAILGTTALLEPIRVPASILSAELPAVIAMSLLLFPLLRSGWHISRLEGLFLLAAYAAAVAYLL